LPAFSNGCVFMPLSKIRSRYLKYRDYEGHSCHNPDHKIIHSEIQHKACDEDPSREGGKGIGKHAVIKGISKVCF